MSDQRPLTCIVSQFALACNLTTVYYLMTLNEGTPGWFFPTIMLAYAPLIFFVNLLFLRRDRTMLALTSLNAFCGGLMLVGYLFWECWRGFEYLVFAGIFLVWLTVRGCRFSRNGPVLRGTLLMLDSSFLLLIASIGYSTAMGWDLKWSMPSVLGLSASLITAALSRSPRTLGLKGWLTMGAAFGLLVVVMWVFVEVMAAPAGSGVIALWSAITGAIHAVKQLVFRFLFYLLSLLPNAEPGEADWYKPPELVIPEETPVSEASPVVGAIILGLAALCGIALLFWLLRHLGKLHLRRIKHTLPVSQPRRTRISVLSALMKILRLWTEAFQLRIRLWKERNTAIGMYFLLVHRCRHSPWRKQQSETPREFLLRMAFAARSDTELSKALEQLAKTTDAAFYSNRADSSILDYAPMIRHRINVAVWKQLLLETLDRLHTRKSEHS